jgi:hypothetical protein
MYPLLDPKNTIVEVDVDFVILSENEIEEAKAAADKDWVFL